MCMSKPNVPPPPPAPELPPERAAQAMPDNGMVQTSAERRATERLGMRPIGTGSRTRSAGSTILTTPSGVLEPAMTERKTLLGQ